MVAALQDYLKLDETPLITEAILSHPAWYGKISGLPAEKLLRGKPVYSYLLRKGESSDGIDTDYYVSYVRPDSSIAHQPFVVSIYSWGWCCENAVVNGPFIREGIQDVLHLIMHCAKEQLIALPRQ